MAYAFPEPGDPVLLIEDAPAKTKLGADCGLVTVELPLRADARVRWQAENGCDLDTGSLRLDHPDLGQIEVDVFVENTDGFGSPGDSAVVGNADAEVTEITALWLNLPTMFGWRGNSKQAAVDVAVEGWRFTLGPRPDHSAAERAAQRRRVPFFATHSGTLAREDGQPFSTPEGLETLFGFQTAISFGLGRFVAPALPRGFGADGSMAWEGWQDWRCDQRWGVESWLAPIRRDDVAELLSCFMTAWLDPARKPTIRYGAFGSICAHNPKPTAEAGVMLAQAELEALAWRKLVIDGPYSRAEYDSVNATERITEMLATCSIDTSIPDDLEGLLDLATEPGTSAPDTGPGVSAWVRNRLTHPKDPGAPYGIEHLVFHTKLLLLQYLDLVILHEIGYSGGWCRLYPPGRWSGTTEPVPWV